MEGSILVLQTNLYTKPDERGAFKFDNVPDGKYTVKVFHRSGFIHQQTLEIAAGTKGAVDVSIKVPVQVKRAD